LTVLMTTGQEANPGDKGDGNLELGKWDWCKGAGGNQH
jgi:hypothetical protein